MNGAMLVVAFLAAVNPFRVRPGLPEVDGRARPRALAAGCLLVFALGAVAVAAAPALLDGLDVSPETFRLAAGFVMAVAAGWVLWFPHRAGEPELAGLAAAVVPVAFPLLIGPELFVLTISTGADESAVSVLGALALALTATFALGAVPRSDAQAALWRGASRLAAAVLMVAAVALIVSGIREV